VLLAKKGTVGVHDGDAPIARIHTTAAVRAVACRRICLNSERDVVP
jgi:hypothetical protein